jgi:hypothetical protein
VVFVQLEIFVGKAPTEMKRSETRRKSAGIRRQGVPREDRADS